LDTLSKRSYQNGDYGDQSLNDSFYPSLDDVDAMMEDEEMTESGYAGYPEYDIPKSASSDLIIDGLIDRMDFYDVYGDVEEEDEATAQLMLDVFEELADALEPDRKVKMALNRLKNVANGRLRNVADIRNQIAKAANLLGMKTPPLF